MHAVRTILGSLVSAAMLVGAVAPAEARGRDRHWHRHHHRDNGFGFGDAVGVAALIGAGVIVANSLKKDRDSRPERAAETMPPVTEADAEERADDLTSDSATSDNASPAADDDETAAVDACAIAARDRASGDSGYAEIRDMADPQPIDGGWNIDGTVEQRAGYRDTAGETRRFTCTVRDGTVANVYMARDLVSN